MTNGEKFKEVFGRYALEMWHSNPKQFDEWQKQKFRSDETSLDEMTELIILNDKDRQQILELCFNILTDPRYIGKYVGELTDMLLTYDENKILSKKLLDNLDKDLMAFSKAVREELFK